MRQSRVLLTAWGKLADEHTVLIKPHAVGVCENIHPADIACRMLAYIHGRGHDAAGLILTLTCIHGRGELWVAEHVHNTVIAYPVSAAEILMSVVVEHAPGEYAADIVVGVHSVEHLSVPQCVVESVALVVKGFCRNMCPLHSETRYPLCFFAVTDFLGLSPALSPQCEKSLYA